MNTIEFEYGLFQDLMVGESDLNDDQVSAIALAITKSKISAESKREVLQNIYSMVSNPNNTMNATIKFETTDGRYWIVKKEFADKKHCDNFIAYICRTKNYMLDELFTNDGTH